MVPTPWISAAVVYTASAAWHSGGQCRRGGKQGTWLACPLCSKSISVYISCATCPQPKGLQATCLQNPMRQCGCICDGFKLLVRQQSMMIQWMRMLLCVSRSPVHLYSVSCVTKCAMPQQHRLVNFSIQPHGNMTSQASLALCPSAGFWQCCSQPSDVHVCSASTSG